MMPKHAFIPSVAIVVLRDNAVKVILDQYRHEVFGG